MANINSTISLIHNDMYLFLPVGSTGVLMQCNSTILAMNGVGEDCGNLYIYKLDEA